MSLFNPGQILQLADLLKEEEKEDNGRDNDYEKGPASSSAVKKEPVVTKDKQAENGREKEIFEDAKEDEVFYDPNEKRKIPEYDVVYGQDVSSTDLYLNLHGKSALSQSCEKIIFKFRLPLVKDVKEIQLDVTKNRLLLSTEKDYYLYMSLPKQIIEGKGNAQWNEKKKELRVEQMVDSNYL